MGPTPDWWPSGRARSLNCSPGAADGQTEIVRLDDRDLGEDPARLEVELRTAPMFAAQSVIRVTAGPKLDPPSLKSLLATEFDNPLIVEAGNLRPDSGLRKLFESHKTAAALPCYGDASSALARLIDAELAEAGLSIDRETRDYLMTRLGADQALSRSEVVKLALYAQGGGSVSHDDIERHCRRCRRDGARELRLCGERRRCQGGAVGASAPGGGRHRQGGGAVGARTALHPAPPRGRGDQRRQQLEQSVKSLRPRPHFNREPVFLAHCKRWGAARLARTLPLIQEAVRRTRRSPELEGAFAERLVLTITSRI